MFAQAVGQFKTPGLDINFHQVAPYRVEST